MVKRRFLFLLFLAILSLVFQSSSPSVIKEKYEVKVGETFRIFFKSHTCCDYCITNNSELKNVQILSREVSQDCDHCEKLEALLIQGINIGTDTVKLSLIEAGGNCDNTDDFYQTDQYIIEVK